MSTPAVPSLSFEQLYQAHHSWLRAWLTRKLANRSDAADLAQDTFVRVLTGAQAHELQALHQPRAYLTTVAKRLLINHYERQALERAYLESLALLPERVALSEEDRAVLLETLQELDALLDALPDKVRAAFLACQLDGLGYDEIAVQLHVSVRTVTRYMAQAFRQCLQLSYTPGR